MDEWFRCLTDAEIGYYFRLIGHAWVNGSIPSDPKRRRALFRVHWKTDELAFGKLSAKFTQDPIDPSRLLHIGLEEQRNEILIKSQKGLESANRRWVPNARASDSDSDSSSSGEMSLAEGAPLADKNTTRARDQKPPDPEMEFEPPSDIWPTGRMVWTERQEDRFLHAIGWCASPTEDQVAKLMAADGALIAGDGSDGEDPARLRALRHRVWYFDLFWRDYWRKEGKKKAREIWLKVAITEDDQALIAAAADRQAPAMLAKEKRYRPHAATWLGQERWNDEVAEPAEEERSLWMMA